MHHYTYLTTDLQTYEFYVGVRSCECDPKDDPYLGSGRIVSAKVKKYGPERFYKRVLRTFSTREGALAAEGDHVTQKFLDDLRPLGCMNLVKGGGGKPLNAKHNWPAQRKKAEMTEKRRTQINAWMAKGGATATGRAKTEAEKQRLSQFWKECGRPPCSDEHKRKISEVQSGLKHSPERIQRNAEAQRAAWARRKADK